VFTIPLLEDGRSPSEADLRERYSATDSVIIALLKIVAFLGDYVKENRIEPGYSVRFNRGDEELTFAYDELENLEKIKGLSQNQIRSIINSLNDGEYALDFPYNDYSPYPDSFSKIRTLLLSLQDDARRLLKLPIKRQNLNNHLSKLVKRHTIIKNDKKYSFNIMGSWNPYVFRKFRKIIINIPEKDAYYANPFLWVKYESNSSMDKELEEKLFDIFMEMSLEFFDPKRWNELYSKFLDKGEKYIDSKFKTQQKRLELKDQMGEFHFPFLVIDFSSHVEGQKIKVVANPE
jgi:hypothetical protein